MLLFFDVLVRIKKKKKIGGRDKNGERERRIEAKNRRKDGVERKAEEGKRAEWGEREREGGREERGRRRGAFSINSFARKRLFLPMIYGFAIDGSLSLSLSAPTDPRACSSV